MRLSRRMYWLANGIVGIVSDFEFGFSASRTPSLCDAVSALLKDVDYLPMAKPDSNYPLGDTP